MDNCVFCKIAKHEQESDILFENDELVVISDIFPRAPVHLLVLPKKHIPSVNELTEGDAGLIADIVLTAKAQAEKTGIAKTGYQLIWHVGKQGAQAIPHLHLQVRGGKQMPD